MPLPGVIEQVGRHRRGIAEVLSELLTRHARNQEEMPPSALAPSAAIIGAEAAGAQSCRFLDLRVEGRPAATSDARIPAAGRSEPVAAHPATR